MTHTHARQCVCLVLLALSACIGHDPEVNPRARTLGDIDFQRTLNFGLRPGCFHRMYRQTDQFLIGAFYLARSGVDARTLAAYVDGESVRFEYNTVTREIRLFETGRQGSSVDLAYCLTRESIEDPNNSDGQDSGPQDLPDQPGHGGTVTPPSSDPPPPSVNPVKPSPLPKPAPKPVAPPKPISEEVSQTLKFSLKGASVELKCSAGRVLKEWGYKGTQEKCEISRKSNSAVFSCVAKPGTCQDQKPLVSVGRSTSGTCDAKVWIECR